MFDVIMSHLLTQDADVIICTLLQRQYCNNRVTEFSARAFSITLKLQINTMNSVEKADILCEIREPLLTRSL